MQIWHWFGGIYAILYEPPMVIQVNHGPHTHTHTRRSVQARLCIPFGHPHCLNASIDVQGLSTQGSSKRARLGSAR